MELIVSHRATVVVSKGVQLEFQEDKSPLLHLPGLEEITAE
jgi:hypothetical protein